MSSQVLTQTKDHSLLATVKTLLLIHVDMPHKVIKQCYFCKTYNLII